ncbi:MAG: rhodanese-related sulfurtransferase [Candidatus Pacearchaeota archaeon]
MDIHILLFYKFVEISDLERLSKTHLKFCTELGIRGKVLLATEGINGSVSGTLEQTERYKEYLKSDPRFASIEFKEEIGLHHPFDKMVVKIKPQIIRLDKVVDITKSAKHLSPQEFLEVSQKEDVVILDTRNDYEYKAGKFKGAINPQINNFREFPDFVNKSNIPKDKHIVMYCTGGIRCEKASAYMVEQGFTKVSQLHGGIINFCQQLPNTVWEGTCFVFDKRLTSKINQDPTNKTFCQHCKSASEFYNNCKNKLCNELIFICPDCEDKFHACCSNECMKVILKGN